MWKGTLASITDDLTNKFVNVTVATRNGKKGKVFLGGYRTGPDTFAWTDGSIWNYSNWGSGQPDTASHNCIISYGDGTWDDNPCSQSFAYVCQTQAASYKG